MTSRPQQPQQPTAGDDPATAARTAFLVASRTAQDSILDAMAARDLPPGTERDERYAAAVLAMAARQADALAALDMLAEHHVDEREVADELRVQRAAIAVELHHTHAEVERLRLNFG